MYILFKKTVASLTVFSLFWSNLAFCMEPDERPYTAMRSPSTSTDAALEVADDAPPPPPPSAASPADGDAADPRAIELAVSRPGNEPAAPLPARRNSPPGGAVLSISTPIADVPAASPASGPGNEPPVPPLSNDRDPSHGADLPNSGLVISIVPVGEGSAASPHSAVVSQAAAPSSPTAAPASRDHRDSPESRKDTPPSAGAMGGDNESVQLPGQLAHDDSPFGRFLRARGWTRESLRRKGIDLPVLEEIANVELRWCPPRWDSFDLLVEKLVYPCFLNRQGIYYTNDQRNAPDAKKQCCGCFFIQGRAVPFKSGSEVCRATTLNTLRLGIEDGIRDGIHITFFSLLLYQLAHATSVNLVKTYLNADETSLVGIAQLLRENQGLLVLPCIPLLVGLGKALWRACNIDSPTRETVDIAKKRIEGYGQGFFDSYVLPLIPFTPLRRALTTLEPLLLWQGQLPGEHRELAFKTLVYLANTQSGYALILVMNTIGRVVHGLHLMDFGMLTKNFRSGESAYTKEDLVQILSMKTRGLQVLRDLRQKLHTEWQKCGCPGALRNIFQVREIIEINSLLWGLGQSPSRTTSAAVFMLKAAQLVYNGFFFLAIAQTLKSFFDCPNRPGFSWENGGYQDWSMSYTIPCFDEVVRQFNTIPGQPVATLTDRISEFYFPGNTYDLDLSNKGLTGDHFTKIADAFSGHGVRLTSLNAEGNFVNKASDFQRLFPRIRFVQRLSLANNGIEWNGVGSYPEDTIGLAESIGNLTLLQHFDVSRNRIGINSFEGMVALGRRLASRVLTHFNFSKNFMGRAGSDGAVAFGNFALRQLPFLTELDLSDNMLENIDSLGTQAIMNATRALPLLLLSLRNNLIGTSIYDPFGLGALGNGLPLTLTELDVSGNLFARADFSYFDLFTQGLRRLSGLQRFRIHPQIPGLNATHVAHLNGALGYTQVSESEYPFTPLNTNEEVDAYFDTFLPTTSDFNLRARIGTPSALPRVMARLAGFPIRSLDVSENWFEYSDPQGAVPFGRGLRNLTLLERVWFQYNFLGNSDPQGGIAIFDNLSPTIRFIDGSHNVIGGSSDEDTRASGRNLPRFPRLTTLLLADNAIEITGIQGTIELGNGISASSALTQLDLSYNYMGVRGPDGLITIAQGLRDKPVTFLSLANNFMGWTGTNETAAFAVALLSYNYLQFLDVSVNNLGSKGIAGMDELVRALPTLPDLQTIRLAGAQNVSWTEGAQALASLKGDALRQACEAERCFGTPLNPTTSSQNTDQGSTLAASSQAAPASPTQVDIPAPSPKKVHESTPKGRSETQKTSKRPVINTSPSHEDVVQHLVRTQLQQKGKWDSVKSWFSPSSWIDWATQAAHNLATEIQPDGTRVNAMPATFPHLLNPRVNDWAVSTGEKGQSANLHAPAMAQLPLPGAAPMAIGAP